MLVKKYAKNHLYPKRHFVTGKVNLSDDSLVQNSM